MATPRFVEHAQPNGLIRAYQASGSALPARGDEVVVSIDSFRPRKSVPVTASTAAASTALEPLGHKGRLFEEAFFSDGPFAGTNAAALLLDTGAFFGAGVAFSGADIAPKHSSTELAYSSLQAQMQQIRTDHSETAARVRELIAKVDALAADRGLGLGFAEGETRPVPASSAAAARADSLDDLLNSLGADIAGDHWAELFEYAADLAHAPGPAVVPAAVHALKCSLDLAVKAGAARALANLAPETAKALLSELEPAESNRHLRRAYSMALKAATLV